MTTLLVAEGPTRVPEAVPAWRPRSVLSTSLLGFGAFASLLAALVHVQVAPEHFDEWWGYGAFFVLSALAQIFLAGLLLSFATGGERKLPAVLRAEPLVFGAGIAGNALLLGLYAWTRTFGNFAGPMAGMQETVEPIDLVAKTAESLLVVSLVILVLLRRR